MASMSEVDAAARLRLVVVVFVLEDDCGPVTVSVNNDSFRKCKHTDGAAETSFL